MPVIEITRRDNETAFNFHKRIIYGKLVDKTLADSDYSELAELVYGKAYSSDVARRMMYGSKETIKLMEEEGIKSLNANGVLNDFDSKIIELKKERQKMFDQRNALAKIIRERSRQEELNEIIVSAVHSGQLPELNYEFYPVVFSDNDLLVSLNDLHYGANYSNYWGEYNSDICKEMLCEYLDRIIAVANTHQSENCIIWQNGDCISGSIHRSIQVTNKENVIQQVIGVSELIAEFIAELSRHFNKVMFVSVAGNHSRIEPNKENALVEERLDDLIEWYLGARLQNFENVCIGMGEKIDPTMYLINVRGKNYVGVHGDFDGSATKIQSLQTMVGQPVYAVLSGHMHHNRIDEVQGVKTVMAGSFLGMDDYCVQKRIYGKPQQMICVCDNTGIRCSYDVNLR